MSSGLYSFGGKVDNPSSVYHNEVSYFRMAPAERRDPMDQADLTRMETAMAEARAALQEGEIPVGAALYRGETLLWADHNRREQLRDPTAHA